MFKHFPLFALLATAAAVAPLPASAQIVSLAGDWRFELDPSAEQHELVQGPNSAKPLPPGDGIAQEWFKRDLTGHIKLPGILQAQGFGNEISPTTPWVLTLGDAWWKIQPASLRDQFSQPGKVEVPFLAQPPRHYLGVAWYQRDLEVPASWKDRPVKLFLERAHWETAVWIDDQAYPANNSLVAPHISELGVLAPGKHRLSIRIDNRRIVFDPANNGHGDDAHSVSDALGAAWNGIVGRIELTATSPVWIEDAQVYPNVAKKSAVIKVTIGNRSGQAGSGQLAVGPTSVAATWDASGGQAEVEVPLGANAVAWDEFHPKLQHLTVTLKGGGADDSKPVDFGLREVTHNDRDLLVNGRVVNLRLTHFGGDFPLTGAPATDVNSWKKIIKTCQDFGLNGIRFHSWFPPEAAFTAADEMGFYLQPECGMWSPFNPGSVWTNMLEQETPRALKAFGNHPSFILFSPSNEPSGRYPQVTPKWAAAWYAKDNRRLYSAGTGWADPSQVTGGAQYATLVRFGGGELRNASGWFGRDYRVAVENVHIPILAHEVGQWCAYPDFDVIKEFTGYLRPSNYDIFKFIAAQQGVLEYNHAFAWASGRFQLACYKEEIEANLRTPGLSGYQLLDLHDYLGQGTALIGVVDAFWRPKSYITAQEFRRFNGVTVPLARLTQRTFTTGETLTSDVELYHFGEKPLTNATPYWKIVNAVGRTLVEGQWEPRDIPLGKNIPLGKISVDLSKLAAPQACKLVVGLKNLSVQNDWNFWLYPAQVDPTTPESVLVTQNWSEAAARLATGGKVFFTPGAKDLDPGKSPPMQRVPVFWNIQMSVRPPRNPTAKFDAMLGLLCDPKHPALAKFPTDSNCDWQWTPLVDKVHSINLSNAPRELRPIVAAIDDWNRDWRLGVIFECKVGSGRLLVSAIDLQSPSASIGAQQLRRSLLDYMVTGAFRPAATLTPEQALALWSGPSSATPPPPANHPLDPDLDDGSGRRPTPKKS
jgi:beta-galactosidase